MLPDRTACWVTAVIGPGSRVTSVRRLRLGTWHVNHAIDVLDGRGGMHRLVLRRWARHGWEDDDPDYTVEREVRVLELLRSTQVPAPTVVAADPAGVYCDVPAILLTRLPGHPPRPADIGDGFCQQLAEALARIHEVDRIAERQLDAYRLYYQRHSGRRAGTPRQDRPGAVSGSAIGWAAPTASATTTRFRLTGIDGARPSDRARQRQARR